MKPKTLLKCLLHIFNAVKFLFSSDIIFLIHPPIRISFAQLFVLDSRNISKSRCQMFFGNNHQCSESLTLASFGMILLSFWRFGAYDQCKSWQQERISMFYSGKADFRRIQPFVGFFRHCCHFNDIFTREKIPFCRPVAIGLVALGNISPLKSFYSLTAFT